MNSSDLRIVLLATTLVGGMFCERWVRAESPTSAAHAALFDRLDADRDGKIAQDEVPSEHERLFARLVRRSDTNGDKSLTRDEFVAGLVPTRPEKSLEEKQPTSNPQADAIRWLLLTMDTSGNSAIEKDEVPKGMERVYDSMARRIDADENGTISSREIYQGGRQLGQIAARHVESEEIDVKAELAMLEKRLGPAAQRFDDSRPPRLDGLNDPAEARQLFARLDGNGSGKLEKSEIPEQLQRPMDRVFRQGDRDNDGHLTEREFMAAAQQMGRRREGRPGRRPDRRPVSVLDSKSGDSMPSEKSMPDDSMPAEAMPADGN